MRKSKSVIILLSLLLGGGFFACTKAQYYDTNIPQSEQTEQLYMINNPLQHIFLLLQRINPLLQHPSSQHAAADENIFIKAPRETIIRLLDESEDFDEFTRKMRISITQSLIDMQYPNFITKPYQEGTNLITVQSGDFTVHTAIGTKDMLDTLLSDKLSLFRSDFTQIKKLNKHLNFSPIHITDQEYQNLGPIFLFKTEQDLRDLGYELVSWKTRINEDRDYRRWNIMAAFHNMGNVRLLMPGEIFSTLKELHYTPGQGEYRYMSGYATMGGGVELIYGGGLCGVATALYQGSLTNLGLALIQYRAHSIYYRNLYEAEINGITIKDPGLDATIFSPVRDLKLKNIREYPIILVFAFDGKSGSQEQVFTISKAQDIGIFEYIGTYKKGGSQCFTRKINELERTNCYSQIRNF